MLHFCDTAASLSPCRLQEGRNVREQVALRRPTVVDDGTHYNGAGQCL